MADPKTTIRTEYYKRPYPYTGTASNVTAKDVEKKIGSTLLSMLGGQTQEDLLRRDALMKATGDWLKPILTEIAKARLSSLNSDEEWTKSKKYGWGHKLNFADIPDDSEYFTLKPDELTGGVYVDDTDAALELLDKDPKQYETLRKVFEDYVNKPYSQELVPATREMAEKLGLDWYPSTNEILNSLLATKLGEGNRKPLYDATQQIFEELLNEDHKSENPQYAKAVERLIAEGHGQLPGDEFAPSNWIKEAGMNMIAPFSAAVHFDPELRRKTPTWEKVARGVADAGLDIASISLPEFAGPRLAMLAMGPAKAAVIGGAAGGLANYGLRRGVNQGFDMATGKGGLEYPIDLADMGIETAFGSFGGLSGSANKILGNRALRRQMLSSKPSAVSLKDIASSARLAEEHGNKEAAALPFSSEVFKSYEKKYPQGAKQFSPYPPLVGIDPSTGRYMALQTDRPAGKRVGKVSKTEPYVVEHTDPTGKTVRNFDDPKHNEFMGSYRKKYPLFFDRIGFDDSQVPALSKLARKAQESGAPEKRYFGSTPITMSDKDFAKLRKQISGRNFDDETNLKNQALMKLTSKGNVDVGNLNAGVFTPADAKQTKAYNKAYKKYDLRNKMKLVDKTDIEKANKNTGLTTALKLLPLINAGVTNVIPWGSNYILDVQPYTYEADKD